jgi:hypothetical protein
MDFDAAFDRIKRATGSTSQARVAKALGIRQGAVSDAKRRGVIPKPWLFKLESKYKLAPEWVLTGEGPQFILSDGTPADGQLQGVPPSTQAELDLEEYEIALRDGGIAGYEGFDPREAAEHVEMLRELLREERVYNLAPGAERDIAALVLFHGLNRAAARHLVKVFLRHHLLIRPD